MKIIKLHKNAIVPTYAHETDACFDLYASTVNLSDSHGEYISQAVPVICGTGLAFEVPPGYAMLVFSRSGHAFKHNVRLSNCVGVIDSGFTGEVRIKLTSDHDLTLLYVKPGDRIAQAMLVEVPRVTFEVVEAFGLTQRGAGGFGSSGS